MSQQVRGVVARAKAEPVRVETIVVPAPGALRAGRPMLPFARRAPVFGSLARESAALLGGVEVACWAGHQKQEYAHVHRTPTRTSRTATA
ncbi:hypothetical protein [Streptomyces sp. NBC_00078]|uniref:hypothetical protein n=1 Tax=unclassified Streptomyces TaxID=2593676 RepID=UPI00224E10D0|nr:hypothetical protein [Streptomyces sp. NBC_00078]MCX5426054.1 hypothetical protein [Streptomyces sp. NBC_00078]